MGQEDPPELLASLARRRKSSEKFREWAKKEISKTGPLHLSDAISAALTHPDFGYYHSEEIIGRKGDFITAPEVSQMFGELVAIWCVATWEKLGKPATIQLVEMGPGKGTLMKDMIRTFQNFPEMFKNILFCNLARICNIFYHNSMHFMLLYH